MAFSRKISTVELRDLTAKRRCFSCSLLSLWVRGIMQARIRRILTTRSPMEDFRRSVRRNNVLKSSGIVDSVSLIATRDLQEVKLFGKRRK
jgi:hypothetical protein